MAQCPKCHKELDELDCIVNERNQYGYHDGEIDWSQAGELFEYQIESFRCPHCYQELTKDQVEADKLLEKGDESDGGNVEQI